MKKLSFFLVLSLSLWFGCTKESAAPEAALNNTSWYGVFAYKGEIMDRVMQISLNQGGDFVWQDISGKYSGKWALVNDDLTITFTVNGIQTKFKLADNNLSSPTNLNHSTWAVKNIAKIETKPTELSNSKWIRSSTFSMNFASNGNNISYGMPGNGGGGTYALQGNVLSIDKAHFNASNTAIFWGVFINDKVLVGNFMKGRTLSDTPTILENLAEYSKQ